MSLLRSRFNSFVFIGFWFSLFLLPSAYARTVSGTITPATVSVGATVTVVSGGTTVGSSTVSSSGSYSISGISRGTYSVVPTKSGVTFTPTSRSITVRSSNVTGVNFTASGSTSGATYGISGTITGGAGASVVLSGAQSSSAIADSSGNFNFTGLANGSYTVTPNKIGYSITPTSKTVSISGANVIGVNFTAGSSSATSTTIWSPSAVPASPAEADAKAVELGVRFRSDVDGVINGIRFYKGATNTGTHTGTLWSNTGTRLATATFTNETASGWQEVTFAQPVAITANTLYVASYYTSTGHYSLNLNYFVTSADNAPLHAPADGTSGSNGVYVYGTGGVFPTNSWAQSNYWVDVVFVSSGGGGTGTTYGVSGTISGGAGATVSLSGTQTASTTADASGNYSFTGLANGTYTVTPTRSGYSMTPTSKSVTVSGANVSGVNFTATASTGTYAISGTISGGAGATVALSGAKTMSTTANSSGAFSFTGLANGTYTVTPSMVGYTMTPTNKSVTVNGANVTGVNFTAAVGAAHSVDLSWTASTSSTVSGYKVYRSTISGSGYALLNSAPVTSTFFQDTNVAAGTTYYYVVRSVDSSGSESINSNQATAAVPTP